MRDCHKLISPSVKRDRRVAWTLVPGANHYAIIKGFRIRDDWWVAIRSRAAWFQQWHRAGRRTEEGAGLRKGARLGCC
ncbi:hypothetical protein V6N13_024865 [Hibiscus sabdariffa]|uniref:Uncharacterized protein n=2 Tax=Hibiscus sabdariffa TaxID=183260 RepID=A0ABR2QGI0_9ROSI